MASIAMGDTVRIKFNIVSLEGYQIPEDQGDFSEEVDIDTADPGHDSLHHIFAKECLGLKKGDKKQIDVLKDTVIEPFDEELLSEIPKDKVVEGEISEGCYYC